MASGHRLGDLHPMWVAVSVSWLFPHLDLPLRALAPFGLTAAICRTIVTVLLQRGRPVPRIVLGVSWSAEAALLTLNPHSSSCSLERFAGLRKGII